MYASPCGVYWCFTRMMVALVRLYEVFIRLGIVGAFWLRISGTVSAFEAGILRFTMLPALASGLCILRTGPLGSWQMHSEFQVGQGPLVRGPNL